MLCARVLMSDTAALPSRDYVSIVGPAAQTSTATVGTASQMPQQATSVSCTNVAGIAAGQIAQTNIPCRWFNVRASTSKATFVHLYRRLYAHRHHCLDGCHKCTIRCQAPRQLAPLLVWTPHACGSTPDAATTTTILTRLYHHRDAHQPNSSDGHRMHVVQHLKKL